jgi:osmotically inducible protein OsmC
MKRSGTAVWHGSAKEGEGHISTQSGRLDKAPYSFHSRFEDGPGTNPEELVAAAHAGCFTMQVSFTLREKGYSTEALDTKCFVTFENGLVTESHLVIKAKVPGVPPEKFMEAAEWAKDNCPMSKLLKTKITMDATII